MLTRSPTADPKTLRAALNSSQQYSGSTEAGKSVISNDLKIIGQGLRIISRGTLQVDGEVEGDVAGKEIIIAEMGSGHGHCGRGARDCAR
jgi:cytoskeletal protein CcmA (bactofilin family)